MAVDVVRGVRKHLERLTSLREAQELFVELNYSPAADRLPRVGWNDEARDALADDPQVIAQHGNFRIVYSRLNADGLSLSQERIVINKLLPQHEYALYLFSDKDARRWHFV